MIYILIFFMLSESDTCVFSIIIVDKVMKTTQVANNGLNGHVTCELRTAPIFFFIVFIRLHYYSTETIRISVGT